MYISYRSKNMPSFIFIGILIEIGKNDEDMSLIELLSSTYVINYHFNIWHKNGYKYTKKRVTLF